MMLSRTRRARGWRQSLASGFLAVFCPWVGRMRVTRSGARFPYPEMVHDTPHELGAG